MAPTQSQILFMSAFLYHYNYLDHAGLMGGRPGVIGEMHEIHHHPACPRYRAHGVEGGCGSRGPIEAATD